MTTRQSPSNAPDQPLPQRNTAEWHALNTAVVEEFRANGGRVGGPMEGHDLVLLTTAGAKTGLPRTVVLVYFTIDDRMIVVGSKGGAPTHPDWVFNVRADPRAHAETAAASFDVVAHELSEADNASTYRRIIEREPRFGAYKEMTAGIRTIPLFELTRPITHRS